MKNIVSNIVNLIKSIYEKLKSNKSIYYYFLSAIFIVGLLFFISSNKIFNDSNEKIRSTTLNEIQTTNTLNAKIISRKYNSFTKLVELIVYAEDCENIEQKELVFQLREQLSPNMVIPTRFQKVDDNYYVIFAEVKNWEVLSLTLGYENSLNEDVENGDVDIENINENSNKKTLTSIVRIYSDFNDIQKDKLLKERKNIEYLSEIMDLEISFIHKDIDELNTKIDEDNTKINDASNKILELKKDKKYQTESEQNSTDININKLKNVISLTRINVDKDIESMKELKDKISKLEQKKKDFGA